MSKLDMLTPQNSAIALIDFQPAMYQGVQSHNRLVPFNNVQILAKTAKLFKVPTVISPAQLTVGDRITVRIRAAWHSSLSQVESTPANHIGEHEPPSTAITS